MAQLTFELADPRARSPRASLDLSMTGLALETKGSHEGVDRRAHGDKQELGRYCNVGVEGYVMDRTRTGLDGGRERRQARATASLVLGLLLLAKCIEEETGQLEPDGCASDDYRLED